MTKPMIAAWAAAMPAMAVMAALLLAGCASPSQQSAEALAQQAEAQIALAKLRDKEARAEYNDQAVYLGLIARMQQEGLYFASLAHIDAFQQRFGTQPGLQLMRAAALRETGQDDAALGAYRELLTTDRAAAAHHGIGLVLGRQGDFVRAAVALRQAAALDPVNPQVANDLGYALMRSGALQDARIPVMQALQLDGSNPRIVSNAAVWLWASGKRAEANAMMQRAAMPEATRAAVRKEGERAARAALARERTPATKPLALLAPANANAIAIAIASGVAR